MIDIPIQIITSVSWFTSRSCYVHNLVKRYFLISMVLYMSDSMVAVYELYHVKNKLSLIETTVDEKQTVALFPTWSQPVFALAP